MKVLFAAAAAAALVAVAAPASAQTYGSIGYSSIDADDVTLGAVTGRVGHRFGFVGLEGEVSTGVKGDAVTSGATTTDYDLGYSYAGYVTGTVPVTPNLDIMGRVGYGRTKFKAFTGGTVDAIKDDSLNYGVAAQFNWGQNGIRGDWTRHDFRGSGAGEADAWTVSYVRKF